MEMFFCTFLFFILVANVYMFIFYFYQNMSNFIVSNWEGQNPRL